MAKQHTIENLEDLRKTINRDYLIRLTFPKEHKRIVVGFTKFCDMVGNLENPGSDDPFGQGRFDP